MRKIVSPPTAGLAVSRPLRRGSRHNNSNTSYRAFDFATHSLCQPAHNTNSPSFGPLNSPSHNGHLSPLARPTTDSWRYLFGIILFLALWGGNLDAATGIFVTKKTNSHPDSTATVLEYNVATPAGPVTYFTLPRGQQVKVTKFQLVGIYPYVNPMRQTIRSSELDRYVALLEKYQAIADRHDQAKPLLRRQLEVLQEVVENLKNDQAWYQGKWMPDQEIENIIAQMRRDAIDEENAKERERIQQRKQAKIDEIQKRIDDHESQLAELENSRERDKDRRVSLEDDFSYLTSKAGQAVEKLTETIRQRK